MDYEPFLTIIRIHTKEITQFRTINSTVIKNALLILIGIVFMLIILGIYISSDCSYKCNFNNSYTIIF